MRTFETTSSPARQQLPASPASCSVCFRNGGAVARLCGPVRHARVLGHHANARNRCSYGAWRSAFRSRAACWSRGRDHRASPGWPWGCWVPAPQDVWWPGCCTKGSGTRDQEELADPDPRFRSLIPVPRSPGPLSPVPGPWSLVPGPWSPVPGPCSPIRRSSRSSPAPGR